MEDNKNTAMYQEEVKAQETTAEETTVEEVSEETQETIQEKVKEEKVKEEEVKEAVEEQEDKAAEYLDKLQRLMAEFDNYRKRSEREKRDAYDFAVSDTVQEILPIVDNFERALKIETADKAFFEGVSMIYKQLMGALEHLKVTPIPAINEEFDPNLHNAIFHIDDENYGENIVVEELQKGYLYKEKVIRHSMVKVAN